MKTNPYRIASKSNSLWYSVLGASLALGGCTGSKIAEPRSENPQRIAIDDFLNTEMPANEADQSETTRPNTTINTEKTSDSITLVAQPNTNTHPILSTPAQPAAVGNGSLTLLDAKVGDVNGKPIFTTSFFSPIEDRLTAEASRLPGGQWKQSAGRIIANRLDGIIADELLRAEALAALTPNQRVGLQAFLGNFRNNLLSENLGSTQLANRRIQKQQGQTLDEALEQKEIDTLVQLTLIQEVNRRVNVSWRDIKQRYERDIDQFSPPPTAMLRVIRAFNEYPEKIAQIQSELDGGANFVAIAAGTLNNFKTDTDGLHTVLIEDTYETTPFFGPENLNSQTQQLAVGQSVGPIEQGSSTYWVKLMSIEQETVSLYDAQLKIQRDITYERRTEARNQYLSRLMERAKISSRDEVLMRLLEIAEERYGPQG